MLVGLGAAGRDRAAPASLVSGGKMIETQRDMDEKSVPPAWGPAVRPRFARGQLSFDIDGPALSRDPNTFPRPYVHRLSPVRIVPAKNRRNRSPRGFAGWSRRKGPESGFARLASAQRALLS